MIAAPKGDEEDDAPPANIIKHIRERDSKLQVLESEVKRMNDQIYRLKEELVPVFKVVREKVFHPLFTDVASADS